MSLNDATKHWGQALLISRTHQITRHNNQRFLKLFNWKTDKCSR